MINWEDIKKKAHEAEAPLSENAWADMEQMLDADKPKGRFKMLWFAAAAAALVALFLGVYTFSGMGDIPAERGDQPVVVQPSVQEQKATDVPSTTVGGEGVQKQILDREEEIATGTDSSSHQSETTIAGQQPGAGEEKKAISTGQTEPEPVVVQNDVAGETPSTAVPGNSTTDEKAPKNSKTVQTEPTTAIPAKPIGLPHQPWSSPSPKIFGVGSPVLAAAPEAKQPLKPFTYRWEVRGYAMATYNLAPGSYVTQSPTTHVDYAKATDNAVKPGLGFDAGIELKYRVFKHFKIGGGVEYRKLTNSVNFDYQSNKIPLIDSASGNIINYLESPNATSYSYSGNNTYTFISLPISIYYEVPLKGKWSLGAEAIYNHSFLIKQNSTGVNPTQLTIEQQGDAVYQSSLGSAQFRLSLMYQLTPNLYLAAEPAYRQYMQSFNKTENVNWTPRDLSLSMSMIYRFNH